MQSAWHQLGVIMDSLGQIALSYFGLQASFIRINPNYAESHNNLGIIAV
ncbi:MAG UNVERIFIED_CONTAM: hypothetical protein LVR29_10155 [Microcystis novacekii LVE1205-3]|jgi:lipoprotein NlpI